MSAPIRVFAYRLTTKLKRAKVPDDSVDGIWGDILASSKFERSLFQLQIRPTTKPNTKDVPSVSLSKITDILHTAFEGKLGIAYLDANGNVALEPTDPLNAIYIAGWDRTTWPNYDCILLHRGDPQEVNPAFVRTRDRQAKVVKAGNDEAPGRSAHLIIERSVSNGNYAKAVLEQTIGLNRGIIISFFNELLREMTETDPHFTYNTTEKRKVVQKRFQPRIRVSSSLSASLKEDIENGSVSAIDLIKRSPKINGLDFDQHIHTSSAKVTLSVEENTPTSFVEKALNKLSKNENFDEMQVHIRDIKGKSASPRRSMQEYEAKELLYSRKVTIDGFDTPMEDACYDRIQNTIIEKGIEVIKAGKW